MLKLQYTQIIGINFGVEILRSEKQIACVIMLYQLGYQHFH